ncbi:MAG TPA: amidohydrolase family protein, partial [Xenococcaceae cyanobacterium]
QGETTQIIELEDEVIVPGFVDGHGHVFNQGIAANVANLLNDAPVVLPSAMRLLWSVVNRRTRTNQVLGEEQQVTPLEGLKSLTIWSAYQHFEEDSKGSLEPGKLADLVILSANPLTVDPLTIRDIEVLETIKEGSTVYRQESSQIRRY